MEAKFSNVYSFMKPFQVFPNFKTLKEVCNFTKRQLLEWSIKTLSHNSDINSSFTDGLLATNRRKNV